MSAILPSLFWFLNGVIFYVYCGFPLVLWLLSRFASRNTRPANPVASSVTLVISAYNERDVIGAKIENALALDYPKDQFEIMVISDSSDDGTDEIVARYSKMGVRLVRQEERLGKTQGLNLGVPQTTGEIIIFSDANAMYEPDAVRQLIQPFGDPAVGYVVGQARYLEQSGQTSSAESEGLYWKFESWLKRKESDFGSVVGGDGAIYAIRRELFTPLRPTDINDFLNPLQIVARGYKGVYEPRAICFEHASDSFDKEFRRKVRIISRSLNAIGREPRVLLPWIQPRHWFALLSHKILRWFAPVFLISLLGVTTALVNSPFYKLMLWLQLAFYLLAAAGWVLQRTGQAAKLFYLPYYFCLVNCASLIGIFKVATGALSPTWQTIRQSPPVEDPKVHLIHRGS